MAWAEHNGRVTGGLSLFYLPPLLRLTGFEMGLGTLSSKKLTKLMWAFQILMQSKVQTENNNWPFLMSFHWGFDLQPTLGGVDTI